MTLICYSVNPHPGPLVRHVICIIYVHITVCALFIFRIGADRIIAPPKEENTYKTEPDTFFSIEKAKAVVTRVLKESLAGVQYDENKAGRLTRILADKVKDAIKKLTYGQRYKIVTSVSVGQKKLSSITAASQCIWNDSFDRRVDVKYDNGDIFAMVLAFVLYVE